MANVDSTGKGIIIGSTLTITTATVIGLDHGGQHAILKMPSGLTSYVNQQKGAPYTVGATPSIAGTVVGFMGDGKHAVVKEADNNFVTMTMANAVVS